MATSVAALAWRMGAMVEPVKVVGELAARLDQAGPAECDAMLVKLAVLFDGVSELLPDDGFETFDAIFVSLIPSCSTPAKIVLAETIAPVSRGPGRSIRHLAFDDEILVAKPVIRISPLLLDDHLLALATVKSSAHLLAMCERNRLASSVTDVILSRSNGEIRVALAANPGAELSAAGRARLIEFALDDGGLYDMLAARADMASELEAGEGAARAPAPRPAPQGFGALPPPEQAVRDHLAANAVDLALGELARQLKVPPQAVSKAFALDTHGGFLAYAKAARFGWPTMLRFLTKRYEAGHITPRLQRAETDYNRLTVAEARRVVSLLVAHAEKPG